MRKPRPHKKNRRTRARRWQQHISFVRRAKEVRAARRLRHEKRNATRIVFRRKLLAPKVWALQLTEERAAFLEFISRLDLLVSGGIPTLVSFERVERVSPDATVLFKAELQQLLLKHPRCLTFRRPKSDRIQQVFRQVGLFEDMGLASAVALTRDDVIHWEYASGDEIDNPALAASLLKFASKLPDADRDRLLGSAGEALANCVEHAYDFKREKRLCSPAGSKWWAFSNLRDNIFFVALCDLGCGIPTHLPQTHLDWTQQVMSRLTGASLRLPDSALIRTAAEEGVTSTNAKNRGRGLPDMLNDLHDTEDATLRVFSNYGMVRWDSGRKGGVTTNYKSSICGTIVLWEVRFMDRAEAI